MLALVEAAAFYKVIAVWSKTTLKAAILDKLPQSGLGTDRGFFTFAIRLPEADIICELICVAVKPLLPLLRAPHPDAIFHKPFHHKGRFVRDTSDAVKHEHQQNIKLALLGMFLDDL